MTGLAIRLQVLADRSGGGEEVTSDIKKLQEQLLAEQQDLRRRLRILRGGSSDLALVNLRSGLEDLTRRLSTQWDVTCSLTSVPEEELVPPSFETELHQLVKEAVANAARHGRCTEVRIAVQVDKDQIGIEVVDNGCGIHKAAPEGRAGKATPWSLHERTKSLKGSLMLVSDDLGTRVSMALPKKWKTA
jgi:signal transduction histidine kinase